MGETLLIDLHYLPCVAVMRQMAGAGHVQIEAHENYQKQSYRNRCYVLTSNKVDCLTVPVLKGATRQPIRQVRIDYGQPWVDRHLRCWQSAYGKSPYFDELMPVLEQELRAQPDFLFDLNWALLTICREWLRVETPVSLTEWYEKVPPPGVFDARSAYIPGVVPESGLFRPEQAYQQNFGVEFVPNLSVLDLLFAGASLH